MIEILQSFEHKDRHKYLHKELDELVADFIDQTGNLPSNTQLIDFMKWSYEQTISPSSKKI